MNKIIKRKRSAFLLVIVLLILMLTCLTACDSTESKFVSVQFYVDGILYRTCYVPKGGSLDIDVDIPSKDGMKGVWSSTDFDEINEDMKIDAIYSSVNCTIRFLVEGNQINEMVVKKDSSPTELPEIPEREGYIGYWNYTDFTKISQDITVEAIYEKKSLNIIFKNGEATYATRRVEYGENLDYIPTLPTVGINCSSKWLDEDGNTPIYTAIKSDNVIHAYYYLNINLVDSESGNTQINYDLNQSVESIAVGQKENYDFYGWYYDASFTNKVVFPLQFVENKTIYARWLQTTTNTDFTFADGEITGFTGSGTDLVLPYKYKNASDEEVEITKIADSAFLNNTNITSISLPGTIVEIGESAFEGCTSLTTISYPDTNNVATINDRAFYNCRNINKFEFGKNLESIGTSVFFECSDLTDIDLSNTKLSIIGDSAFINLSNINSISLPNTITEIKENAFSGVSNATFTFASNDNLSKVGDSAFAQCAKLENFVAPKITYLGNGIFVGCSDLQQTTTLSNKCLYELFGGSFDQTYEVITSEGDLYYLPESLNKVTIVANKGTVDISSGTVVSDVMKDTYNVKTVEFVGDFTVIKENAFAVSDTLLITEGNLEIIFPNKINKIEKNAFVGRNDIYSINLPDTLSSIGEMAFKDIIRLTHVNISNQNSLSLVEKDAFANTTWFVEYDKIVKLGNIALGFGNNYINANPVSSIILDDLEGVKVIAPYAFSNINSLINIELPSTVNNIGKNSFSNCNNLEIAILPKECLVFEDEIFANCNKLKEIRIGISKDLEKLFGTTEILGQTYYVNRNEINYAIPNTLEKLILYSDSVASNIQANKYNNLISLKNIELSYGINKIYDEAFSNCTGLLTFTISSSVTEIGYLGDSEASHNGVFVGCNNLNLFVIPTLSQLQIINDKAFKNTSLTNLTIPNKVTIIGDEAFYGTKLEYLTFNSGNDDLSIGKNAFSHITTFKDNAIINLPNNLVSLGDNAFSNDTTLTNVVINDGINYCGNHIFENCNLKEFTLPSSLPISYDSETNECSVLGLLKNNQFLSSLYINVGVKMADLFDGSYPNNLSTIYVNSSEIVDDEFINLTTLERVTILNGVVTIGEQAFLGCNNSNFNFVQIPTSVIEIKDKAFSCCDNLKNFLFADGSTIATLGKYIFAEDYSLSEVFFPNTITNTEFEGMFDHCSSLANTNIPSTVTKIGDYTFRENQDLKEIEIPITIEEIGDYAFSDCIKLYFVNNNFENLYIIGEKAFWNCKKLQKFKAENVNTIGKLAFGGCDYMTETIIVDNIISNDDVYNAIGDSGAIKHINISSNATSFDVSNLSSNLSIIYLASCDKVIVESILDSIKDNPLAFDKEIFVNREVYQQLVVSNYSSLLLQAYPSILNESDYLLNEENNTAKIIGFSNTSSTIAYLPNIIRYNEIDYTVTEIATGVFANNTNLRTVIIPSSVEVIGYNAFGGCTNLLNVNFETGCKLNQIALYAFDGCVSLETIDLPDSIVTIEAGAFMGCSSLTTVNTTSNSKLISIGNNSFENCYELTNFKVVAIPQTEEDTFLNAKFNETLFEIWD
ncbi:MAG: leucine-rich repeat protein [Clostridia bacterium]